MPNVTMREMLEAGVHFGHQTRYWNPGMAPYLFGQRNKIHIINLEKTLPLYEEALNFAGRMASRKATILFVGTKRSAQAIIAEEAGRCGMPYVNRRWLGGLLTNFKTVRGSINRLKEIETMQADGSLERVGKKEQLMYQRELDKLEASLAGIKNMKGIPDALFIIDVGYENIAVTEAVKLAIPVIGVVDSNNSPAGVDYIIPGNDDAIRSIALYAKGMADAIMEGQQSVAHIGAAGDADDLIEIDDSGAPMAGKAAGKQAAGKKTATARKTGAAATPAEAATPGTKKAGRKKVAGKKTANTKPGAKAAAAAGADSAKPAAATAAAQADAESAKPAATAAAQADTGNAEPAATAAAAKADTGSAEPAATAAAQADAGNAEPTATAAAQADAGKAEPTATAAAQADAGKAEPTATAAAQADAGSAEPTATAAAQADAGNAEPIQK